MCEKAFRVKGYFNAHLMNHTGEKPYQGNYVEKDFSKLCKLKKSLWTHIGEKSYQYNLYAKALQFNYYFKTI